MDLRTEFRYIGWHEPSLWLSVFVGTGLAVASWAALEWLGRRIAHPWGRLICLRLLWAFAFVVLLVAPHILLQVFFSFRHPRVFACTPAVGWALLYVPALTLVALGLRERRRREKLMREAGGS